METINSHLDPEEGDRIKKEIENKVAKILKLIKNNVSDKKGKKPEDSSKRSVLIGLIEDIHKEYQSLYSKYDHIRSDAQQKVRGKGDKARSSSVSSSDLEYYSPDENDNRSTRNENQETLDRKHKLSPIRIKNETVDPWSSNQTEVSGTVKELEGQLSSVRIELESARKVNKELEAKNTTLDGQISELEFLLKQKGDEMCEMMKTLKDKENDLTSRVKDLTGQISNLQQEVDSLRAEKEKDEVRRRNKANAQAKSLKEQLDQMLQELETHSRQKSELQHQLRLKIDEVSEIQIQIESLQDELARNAISDHELRKEKENLLLQRDDMKQEIDAMQIQIKKLEEIRELETDRLTDEKERFRAKISELEEMLSQRTDELRTFQKIYKGQENESSALIASLKEPAKILKEESESLLDEKKKLEIQNEMLKLDHEQSHMQFENEIRELNTQIEEQQRVLKEQEALIKKLEEIKPIKFYSLDSPKHKSMDLPTLSPQLLERKIQELAENYQMKMENHIRLLSQRIHVAEQIHNETKDGYKKIKEQLEQESKELNEKTSAFEAEAKEMRDTLIDAGINMQTGLDTLVKKLDESNNNFSERVSAIANELRLTKIWIEGTNKKIKELKHDVETMRIELDDKEKKELILREEVVEMKAKLSKGVVGQVNMNVVSQLEKKVENLEEQLKFKDSLFIGLGEEKREAIRQLCILIDYHRNRYNHLKEVMPQMFVRNKRIP